MFRLRCISLPIAAMIATSISTAPGLAADTVTLPRAIYWDLRASYNLEASKIEILQKRGISEVHIWLNDVGTSKSEINTCSNFSSTDSDGNQYWPVKDLISFTQDLIKAHIKPIYVFSPHMQSAAYINSLSAPEGPLGIARSQHVIDIELDLEDNWRDTKTVNHCASGDPEAISNMLIEAIQGTSHHLNLIVSTTSDQIDNFPIMLSKANVIAPQLYDRYYALTPDFVEQQLKTTWQHFQKPLIPALSVECAQGYSDKGLCSDSIFSGGVSKVAALAECAGTVLKISNFAVWSEVSLRQRSTFGDANLVRTASQPIPVDCSIIPH
jgi:hypothetical protein